MFYNISEIIEDFQILGSRKYAFLRKYQQEDILYGGVWYHLLGYWLYKVTWIAVATSMTVALWAGTCALIVGSTYGVHLILDKARGGDIYHFGMMVNLIVHALILLIVSHTDFYLRAPAKLADNYKKLGYSFNTALFLGKVRDLENMLGFKISEYTKPIYQFHGHGQNSGQCPIPVIDRTEDLVRDLIKTVLQSEHLERLGWETNKTKAKNSKKMAKKLFELAKELGVIEDKTLENFYKEEVRVQNEKRRSRAPRFH